VLDIEAATKLPIKTLNAIIWLLLSLFNFIPQYGHNKLMVVNWYHLAFFGFCSIAAFFIKFLQLGQCLLLNDIIKCLACCLRLHFSFLKYNDLAQRQAKVARIFA